MPTRECDFEKYAENYWRCRHCSKGVHERLLKMYHPCEHERDMLGPRRASSFSCLYRGPVMRIEKCMLCGNRDAPATVYSCTIFGKCTIHAYGLKTDEGDKMPMCITCDRRQSAQIVDIATEV